jgi:PPK2 family polyphosphate:nucleotide phosphotransferase
VTLTKDFDPAFKGGVKKKREGPALLAEGVRLLSEYQARLAAQDTWGVLVVLQALDAAGKDGTIRHAMSGVNPQGVAVHSFKVPSAEELDHDFLWRYAQRLPARGEIGIFNRSHYEEVLVVRVHPENLDRQKLPKAAKRGDVWRRHYREINDWERYLTDNGFRIVKLFLNISKEEQRARFLRRIDLPDHNWKFSTADVRERERWDEYQRAFSETLSHTSTEWAPWYVAPENIPQLVLAAEQHTGLHAVSDVTPVSLDGATGWLWHLQGVVPGALFGRPQVATMDVHCSEMWASVDGFTAIKMLLTAPRASAHEAADGLGSVISSWQWAVEAG